MYRRIVVKLGTSVLTMCARRLDRAHMVEIAHRCAAFRRQG
jgi:glutamate 5-kinase